MAVVYIKSSWCCTGDRRLVVIAVKVGAGPEREVVVVVIVVVVVVVVALEVWLTVKR